MFLGGVMTETDFAVAAFGLFFTAYVLIRMIFAIPRHKPLCDYCAEKPQDSDYGACADCREYHDDNNAREI